MLACSIAGELDAFIQRSERDCIARSSTLRGCSEEDVRRLEIAYGVTLPTSYRCWFEVMGRGLGLLFSYDHWNAMYDDVLRLTREQRVFADEDGERERLDAVLGPRDVIIVGRLDEQFFLLPSDERPDPPVRYYENSSWTTREAYPNVLDMLNAIADECAEAVRGGYFGTRRCGFEG